MNRISSYYEAVGDSLTSYPAERAYRAALFHLTTACSDYLKHFKRLQSKIIHIHRARQ
jgi:hypothetical protein